MCGIAGLVTPDVTAYARVVDRMTDTLVHRGPDRAGIWSEDGVMLGHRRLSIIDLSAAGNQPMHSVDRRWVLSYNGEIYNHSDIRAKLESSGTGPQWKGHSDTESLLAAIAAWGPEAALQNAFGMFALALWDRRERELILARDRFGEKPLYYGKIGRTLAFASELKAMRQVPGFDAEVDPAALRTMLGRGYVEPGNSIFRSIQQVKPGTWLRFSAHGALLAEKRYFDFSEALSSGARDPIIDPQEALERLRETLARAVARQMVADVSVGTLLSGGIDSSLVTAMAVRSSSAPVRTYSIGFAEAGFDEAPMARQVADHLGTDHHERYVTSDEALALIPQLPTMFDEPFGDSSQVPTHIVSRFAKEDVTVALTGDGGDELFGGYRRHTAFPALWQGVGRLPAPVRRAAMSAAAAVPPKAWSRLMALRNRRAVAPFLGNKVQRSARIAAGAASFAEFSNSFLDEWYGWPSPVVGEDAVTPLAGLNKDLSPVEQLMLADTLSYLPGDILTKVDRAAMAVSLEGRIPLLDPEVALLATRIPLEQKIAGGIGKIILRRLLAEMVPRELFERPKAGFAIPLGAWLRGPLRDWAESHLTRDALGGTGLLDPIPIRKRWQEHCDGRADASQAIWSVLAFQAWHRYWRDPVGPQ